jgi:hypothetical protein
MGRTEDATTQYEHAFDSQLHWPGAEGAQQEIDVLAQIAGKLARAYRERVPR